MQLKSCVSQVNQFYSIVHKEGFWETEEYYLMSLLCQNWCYSSGIEKNKYHYLANPEHAQLRKQNFMMDGHLTK